MTKYALAIALLACLGCGKAYYRAVDGTDVLVGVGLPDDEVVRLEVAHYLSGSKTSVREPARITHEYRTAETNSYFGLVKT